MQAKPTSTKRHRQPSAPREENERGNSGSGSTTSRRGREAIGEIKAKMVELLQAEHPMSVRQLFYRLVSAGVIGKSEGEYKKTVVRLLTRMRRAREIPFEWLADATRWQRKPQTFSSWGAALNASVTQYRRGLWANQGAYVEVWLEKEALAGVVVDVTDEWDVALMVTRGYPSLSFLHSAAEAIGRVGKPVFIYYLGDHDPSGVNIPVVIERDLRELAPNAEIHFQRIAVTPAQIKSMGLQTRPTKRTDSRASTFRGGSVEVDAIPPDQLRQLVRESIERHVDAEKLAFTRRLEAGEREDARLLADSLMEWNKELAWARWCEQAGGDPNRSSWLAAVRSRGKPEASMTSADWRAVAQSAPAGKQVAV